ncbi:MAG: hypothetical protein IKH14_01650 [Prevotella sp.]|nr:hypothetical protein [Prevotella sp.]
MKKAIIIILGFSFSFFIEGCLEYEDLYFSNRTNDSLCVYSAVYADLPTYPDTILPTLDKCKYVIETFGPYEKRNIASELNMETVPTIISVFVINKDTLDKYSWHGIRASYNILVRYDFTHQQLKDINWIVCYPPVPNMLYIKMYPSYESIIEKVE